MSQDQYLSRKEVSKSYRPRSYVMSPGLLRARAPFRLQNALTGLVLAGFATAVWAYSIRAVKQDDFSDVDEEAREMMKGRDVGAEDQNASLSATPLIEVASGRGASPILDLAGVHIQSQSQSRPRGVLAPMLDHAFPRLLDPTRKTLVWGAPPIGDLGRVCLRGSTEERR
ncbi:hypothetical protein HD554DRAFT_35679 [Boletus coccyginus]|nr:hypothetical protein HD554DRAFT_35679 [Boletus coccyginus]